MEVAITEIQDDIVETRDEINFIKNFENPYLYSERADYYLWHENWIVYDWEWVIRLRNRDKLLDTLDNDILQMQRDEKDLVIISSPEESRYYFIEDKLKPLIDLWILE